MTQKSNFDLLLCNFEER